MKLSRRWYLSYVAAYRALRCEGRRQIPTPSKTVKCGSDQTCERKPVVVSLSEFRFQYTYFFTLFLEIVDSDHIQYTITDRKTLPTFRNNLVRAPLTCLANCHCYVVLFVLSA